MTKHHYLPASFLARFSVDPPSIHSRDRRIFVGNKETLEVYPQRTGKSAAINNLYSLSDPNSDPELLERKFSEFETHLNPAIDSLISGELDAKTWIRVLVPFVTCMLVRDAGFAQRIKSRFIGFDDHTMKFFDDNINEIRMIEIQKLLVSITIAKWNVINITGREKLMTNDIGFSPFANFNTNEWGISIPLDYNHVLAIIPRFNGRLLKFENGSWKPIISYFTEPEGNQAGLNNAITQSALRSIFSPEESLAKKYLIRSEYNPKPIEPVLLGFLGEPLSTAFEFTWHQLASTLEKNINNRNIDNFTINWKDLLLGWNPFVYSPRDLVRFPSVLKRKGKFIFAEIYNPEVYFKLSKVILFEKTGDYENMMREAIVGIQLSTDLDLTCEFRVRKSNALLELKRNQEALQELNTILSLNPNFLNAWINRGAFYLESGELELAYDDLKRAQKIDPESGIVFLNLGNYHRMKKDYQKSIQEINKAIDRLPKGPLVGRAYLSLGLTYSDNQKKEEAIDNFNLAIQNIRDKEALAFCHFNIAILRSQLHQDNPEQIREIIDDLTMSYLFTQKPDLLNEILVMRSELFQRLNLLDLALADIEEAQNKQNDTRVKFIKADILLQMGLYKQAMGNFQKLLYSCGSGTKNLAKINNNLGICNFMLGNFSAATSFFSKSIDLFGQDPESGSPLRYLCQIALLSNELAKAKDYLQKSKSIDPTSSFNNLVEGILLIYEGKGSQSIKILSSAGSSLEMAFFTILGFIINNENDAAVEILHAYLTHDSASEYLKTMMLIHLESLSLLNNDGPIFEEIRSIIIKSIN
jgi:tetratricopeptide (TPR) repeat protein